MLGTILLGLFITAAVIFLIGLFFCIVFLGVAALSLFLKIMLPILLIIISISVLMFLME